MLTTGLVQYLLTLPSITSLLAGNNAIQPIPAPVDLTDYPCIVYSQVSDVPDYTIDGTVGMSHSRIVFDCFAPQNPGGYLIARNIALAVKAALSGYRGTLPDGTQVFFCEIANLTDGFQSDAMLSRSSVHALATYSD